MFYENGTALDWVALFKLSEQKKESVLFRINHDSDKFVWENYVRLINIKEAGLQDESYYEACKISVLKFCIEDTTFAKDVLSYEDYSKCLNLFSRKQYSGKLLKNLLNKFSCLLSDFRDKYGERINDLFRLDVIRQTNAVREKKAEESFLPLKRQVEKIASGVKGICYLAADNPKKYGCYGIIDTALNQELNKYLKDCFSYDFNLLHRVGGMSLLVLFSGREEHLNTILQRALLDDLDFWKVHGNFNVIRFIEFIRKNNDLRHAEKVVHYIFSEIQKDKIGSKIIEKSLPLNFLMRDKFADGLEERTFRFTFDRFSDQYDLKPVLNSAFCFPFVEIENSEDKILKGKKIANELFGAVYPEGYSQILKFLKEEIENPSPVFSDEKQVLRDAIDSKSKLQLAVRSTEKWTIKSIFDSHTFGYHTDILDREAVEVYSPDYFSAENIWNRLYLKAYYMSVVVKDKKSVFANMFEIFYDLFQFIEKKTGIKTAYQHNTEGREKAFEQLSALLKNRDVHITNNFKEDYIIALLDRKVAIREESERFPVLEQLGDAVYGLSVAELLFYNPEEENVAQSYNDFICAQSQIKVAKRIGTDKLYLSSYSLPRKYERDILIDADTEPYIVAQEREQYSNKHKYIADSLEMIIGTICKDCGFKKAITFTKSILKETFPEKFGNELHWGENHNSDIDRNYWTRILPAPYSHFDNNQHMLWQAFDKFYKAYVLGTEEPENRRFITYSLGDNGLYDGYGTGFEVNRVFYEYLHNGLESAISKYGESVKAKYKESEK